MTTEPMIEAHHSPDDGGWYLYDYRTNKVGLPLHGCKTVAEHSNGVWQSRSAALTDLRSDKVEWA